MTFIFTVLEMLLSKDRSVVSPIQWRTVSKRIKVSLKNQKNIWNLLILLGKSFTYGFKRFWLRNSIFEMPIIIKDLNINHLRNTSAKSLSLHSIRKFVEYSLKDVWKRQCFFLPFWRSCCPKVGRNCDPPSEEQRAKGLWFQ